MNKNTPVTTNGRILGSVYLSLGCFSFTAGLGSFGKVYSVSNAAVRVKKTEKYRGVSKLMLASKPPIAGPNIEPILNAAPTPPCP